MRVACLTKFTIVVRNHKNPMYMIGHDHKFVQHLFGKMLRNLVPCRKYGMTWIGQDHVSIYNRA